MKSISIGIILICTHIIQAQVGVGTTTPNATLEVAGNPTSTAVADGFIPPKLQRAQLIAKTAYGTNQIGAVVYVTDTSGTTNTATVNVTTSGYYFWNGTTWNPIGTSGTPRNIYSENGTLLGNRVVTQGVNSLDFTSTSTSGTSHFTVDGTTFNVDANNNRVGILTNAPQQVLDVNGNIRIRSNNTIHYDNIPDFRLVVREDYETAVTGWTNNTRTTVLGQNILGGFNILAGTTNQKTFNLVGIPHTTVKITFTYYSIDSWDNETGYVRINNTAGGWYRTFNLNDLTRENLTGNATWLDGVVYGVIEVPHTTNDLIITIGSNLNEPSNNESFGIDNLEIWVR